MTARYLWDTAREIIEARCAAISRRAESFNKSWKYGERAGGMFARGPPEKRAGDAACVSFGAINVN